MECIELTAQQINIILNHLAEDPDLSYDQIITFWEALIESVNKKIIDKKEITGSEFLVGCIGYFIFYDLKNIKYSPPVSYHERSSGAVYPRPLNYLDIEEAKERFNRLLSDLIGNMSAHCALNDKKTVFSWFRLIDGLQRKGKVALYIPRYRKGYIVSDTEQRVTTEQRINLGAIDLVPGEFIQHIFYDHYGLDPKIAKDGHPLVDRYNAEEAAKRLGISKYNLIKECLDASFGAYINSGQFKIRRTASCRYNKEMIDAFADVTYPYKYYGLVRLSKSELKILYSEEITTNDKPYSLIKLQPSLAEVIQTFSLFIELRGKQRITINDLCFIEDEIQFYLSNKNTEASGQAASQSLDAKVEKQERSHGLHDLIKEKFIKNPAIKNQMMWKKLKEVKNQLIKYVTSWSAYDAHIEWTSQNGIDQKMSKSTFQKYMLTLRK